MSVTVMALVWSDPTLAPNHRLVLLAYADHADDDGHNVFPGEERMATKTGYSTGNIRRVTAELIDAGYLTQTKKGHRGQRAEFVVNLTTLKAAQSARQTSGKGAQPEPESRANEIGKARGGATPNHQEPSPITTRKKDLLWESFVAVHGEPTEPERGKYNRQVKLLRDADVTPEEYPTLVAAWVSKHGLQPGVATVANRIGELRHYAQMGPLTAPSADEVRDAQQWAEAEDEYQRALRQAASMQRYIEPEALP